MPDYCINNSEVQRSGNVMVSFTLDLNRVPTLVAMVTAFSHVATIVRRL